MLVQGYFKKAVCFSLFGHLAAVCIFSFSFGERIPVVRYANLSSFGAILSSRDISRETEQRLMFSTRQQIYSSSSVEKINLLACSNSILGVKQQMSNQQSKPQIFLPYESLKPEAAFLKNEPVSVPAKKESAIMLYPELPYSFLLYFRDRQVVPIELTFIISRIEGKANIVVKRKVSSGSLEADLLAMRYIGHYLFIQQSRFPLDRWLSVKIELSTKNDKP